jgi:hypothetical protein
MRTVKIYSTTNGLNQLETKATTWGQLKNEMNLRGINYSGMKATESSKNNTLELDEAGLPEGNFVLMLSPQKTKSGNGMSYNELRAAIKALVDSSDEAKAHFNHSGKNYTNRSRAELEELYESYLKLVPAKSETVKVEEKVEFSRPIMNLVEDESGEIVGEFPEDEEGNEGMITDCIDDLMLTDEYNERTDDFELAFQLLRGEITAEELRSKTPMMPIVQEKTAPKLSQEEEEWIRKMQNKV